MSDSRKTVSQLRARDAELSVRSDQINCDVGQKEELKFCMGSQLIVRRMRWWFRDSGVKISW